jgi:hypothetical protein
VTLRQQITKLSENHDALQREKQTVAMTSKNACPITAEV